MNEAYEIVLRLNDYKDLLPFMEDSEIRDLLCGWDISERRREELQLKADRYRIEVEERFRRAYLKQK